MTRMVLAALSLCLLQMAALSGATLDRIAAIVEREVITLSELNQVVALRFFARNAGEDEDEFRRRVLDSMIAQALRFRDVERFGAQDVSKDAVEARFKEITGRFPDQATFGRALIEQELTADEVRALIKRQLQVEAYIQERFSPLIFVSLDEIEKYYRETWSPQRRGRGLAVPPIGESREEIRDLIRSERLGAEIGKWTEQLRARANVDVYAYR
ncbi:MAG TPA: SurA N-terminal domain-containing protein [Thermoanaerobaculia bacterium]|nr:SurA N-terminal domain-containing protein [Thermoanaerobaculia bacterium]